MQGPFWKIREPAVIGQDFCIIKIRKRARPILSTGDFLFGVKACQVVNILFAYRFRSLRKMMMENEEIIAETTQKTAITIRTKVTSRVSFAIGSQGFSQEAIPAKVLEASEVMRALGH